jgi:hypothetical protein
VILEELPDPWLDPESLANVNAMFYGSEPHEYFSHRLELLILAAGRPEVIEEAIRSGISYEGLHVGGEDDGESEPTDEEADTRSHREFVIAETLTLLYHVSETLLRFYLAHERMPECPWIEIAGEPPVGALRRSCPGGSTRSRSAMNAAGLSPAFSTAQNVPETTGMSPMRTGTRASTTSSYG